MLKALSSAGTPRPLLNSGFARLAGSFPDTTRSRLNDGK
jgi:hypothetical protein